MKLVKITTKVYPIKIDLFYASKKNFTGKIIYKKKDCYLHKNAIPYFEKAIELADKLKFKLKIFDAFRPAEAQYKLWEHSFLNECGVNLCLCYFKTNAACAYVCAMLT